MKIELETFDSPDEVFYTFRYEYDPEKFYLEIGTEFIYTTDSLPDEEIEYWAKKNEYLDDPEDGYILEDGTPDFNSLRERRKEYEDEYPDTDSYPSGRAFLYFENLDFELPKNIDVRLVEGPHPGNDWHGVVVNGEETLRQLQNYLKTQEIEVNFIMIEKQ